MVTTLHIEHPISSLPTWLAAFERFEEPRRRAGVIAHRVHQPLDDGEYIVVQLDFAGTPQAASFETFLRTEVWTRSESSPALAGDPVTRLFHDVGSEHGALAGG